MADNCNAGDAMWSYGMQLWRSDDDPNNPTFERITRINQINPPGVSVAEIETTSHDTADGYTTFIPGLATTQNISMNINWDPTNASHQILWEDVSELPRCLHTWRVVIKDQGVTKATAEFQAFVMTFEEDTPLDGRATASVTLKPSGKPTLY